MTEHHKNVDDTSNFEPARGWAYHPGSAVQTSPLFQWPPRPIAAAKWLSSYWFAVSSATITAAFALGVSLTTLPDLAEMATLEPGWMATIWLRNLIVVTLLGGGLHWYFYQYRGQGQDRKFDSRAFAQSNKLFLFNNQIHDNVFWSLVSGVGFMSLCEVLAYWGMANGGIWGWGESWSWREDWNWSWHALLAGGGGLALLWWILLFPLIVLWSSFHFYWVHRWLHWPPLYRLAHALHHKNINVGPWSGLSMHPIEHALYYSSVLIHLVIPSEPVHVAFHALGQSIFPLFSHSGFSHLLQGGTERMKTGDFFHQLHHRHFECNYGTTEMPWDVWFGTFNDGSTKARLEQRERLRKLGRTVGIYKPSRHSKSTEKTDS